MMLGIVRRTGTETRQSTLSYDGSGGQRSASRIQDAPTVSLISWNHGPGVVDLWVPFAQLLISNVDTVRDGFGNAAAAAKR